MSDPAGLEKQHAEHHESMTDISDADVSPAGLLNHPKVRPQLHDLLLCFRH